jgi:uncharacterized membrane protein YphA (DoxX/SURF4 family)
VSPVFKRWTSGSARIVLPKIEFVAPAHRASRAHREIVQTTGSPPMLRPGQYNVHQFSSRRRPADRNAMTSLANSAPASRRTLVAYWITTALVSSELALGGAWDILRVPQVRGLIERLGYPPYFLVILGSWKLLGAVALVIPGFPRLKEWAYAGAIFNLTGAVASLFASRIGVNATAYPIVMIGITVASWALRPPSRRLVCP